ncbi:hypothetical protein HC891_11585 [Candidatus Gracilibacteria bacterium]|nr:hypothetical protein [Candidatus Gracilibacteria bacterium]
MVHIRGAGGEAPAGGIGGWPPIAGLGRAAQQHPIATGENRDLGARRPETPLRSIWYNETIQ